MSEKEYGKLIDDVIAVSEEVDFFRGVPYLDLFHIIYKFDRHILSCGERVFSHGWESTGRVVVILSGEVGIYAEDRVIHTPSGVDIKSPALSILKRGDTLGQIGAMSPLKRPFITKVVSQSADIVSFEIDFSKEKEFKQAFLALYKNAFFRLGKSILTIATEAKVKRKESTHAIESYLANIH
ncbi:MAG: hypothetical protein ACLFQJ_06375 [Campylobacterales bacterium]